MRQASIIILNEVKCNIKGLDKVHQNLFFDKYNILSANYKYSVDYQLGTWDGKIPFFSKHGQTYVYLLPEIIKKLTQLGYKVDVDDRRVGKFYDIASDVNADYFKDIISKKSGKPYQLTDHQIEAVNDMFAAGSGIMLAGTGFGKAQPLHSKILTPDGWTTMGQIKEGDLVITPKNTTAKVIGVYDQGVTDVYKVAMPNGDDIFAHPEHLWKVYNYQWYRSNKQPFEIIDTLELRKRCNLISNNTANIPAIPEPIDFAYKEYTYDPYFIGQILPILRIEDNELIIPISKTVSPKILDYIVDYYKIIEILLDNGLLLSRGKRRAIIKTGTDEDGIKLYNFLYSILESGKGVPDEYAFSTAEVRKRFMQGIGDALATLSVQLGNITFAVADTNVLKSIHDMIHLQGGSINSSRYKLSTYHNMTLVTFNHPRVDDFFTTREKLGLYHKYKQVKKNITHRTIKSVEYHGTEETRCIMIDDPDHLYITDGATITHNTILNAVLVDKYAKAGCKTVTIVPATSLILQTVEQFKDLNLNVSHYSAKNPSIEADHIVTTWQALQNNPNIIKLFQTVVVDECLSENTLVTLIDGSKIKITDIEIGQEILSYNKDNNYFEPDIVEDIHVNLLKSSNQKMYLLEFDNGISIEVTGNHLIYTTNGEKRADELTEEDDVISY